MENIAVCVTFITTVCRVSAKQCGNSHRPFEGIIPALTWRNKGTTKQGLRHRMVGTQTSAHSPLCSLVGRHQRYGETESFQLQGQHLPWRWWEHIPPKGQYQHNRLHGITMQKTKAWIITSNITSVLTAWWNFTQKAMWRQLTTTKHWVQYQGSPFLFMCSFEEYAATILGAEVVFCL